jgi:transcriptional regulator with XRE-family HTH domain
MARREINGTAVREMRKLAGISQPELAKRSGTTQSHMSNIERGARLCSPRLTRSIADALGVPLDAITSVVNGAVAS